MENLTVKPFNIVGITLKTSNFDPELANKMQNLWNKFISENIATQIPNKIDDSIYCVYTEYDGDYTKPYTVLLGCNVNDLETIPTGLSGYNFVGGVYNKHIAKGNILHGVVYNKWQDIWKIDDSNRAYIADFEVYDSKSHDIENAEVDIYVGLK